MSLADNVKAESPLNTDATMFMQAENLKAW